MSIAAGPDRRAIPMTPSAAPTLRSTSQPPTLIELELASLRIRMEALEHLVIVLLADSGTQDLEAVRGLANNIPFQTDPNLHPEMNRAAAQMIRLVQRSDRLRSNVPEWHT